MKLSLAFLSTALAAVAARPMNEIRADSNFGKNLLSKSRQLEQGEVDMSWVPDMSLKFIGCHHISQWNADADGDEDVKIETKRLAVFRLCPSSSCNSNAAKGCSSGYGDYVVDMDEFLASYIENKQEVQEYECEYQAENVCDCEDGDDKDDGFDAEYCEQKCFDNAGMDYCYEKKYYDGYGNEVEKFDYMEYTECAQYEPPEQRRRLDANGYYQEEVEYFVGAYCGNDGASINLGMFTDDACTEFVDDNSQGRDTFYKFEGEQLPYASKSIVESSCVSCQEIKEDDDDKNGGYYYEAAEPNEFCAGAYQVAGKCEANLNNANVYPNENACNFISAIKTTSSTGIINSGNTGGNSVASAFITIFGISFVALGSYVYYLKTKLDRGRINLSD